MKTNKEENKKVLMKFSKETIINLYLSAEEKAKKYEALKELINDMIEKEE